MSLAVPASRQTSCPCSTSRFTGWKFPRCLQVQPFQFRWMKDENAVLIRLAQGKGFQILGEAHHLHPGQRRGLFQGGDPQQQLVGPGFVSQAQVGDAKDPGVGGRGAAFLILASPG